MDAGKVDEIGQAALRAAIATAAESNNQSEVAIVVVVRPLRAGEKLNVSSNIIGNHQAVAATLRDGVLVVMRDGAQSLTTPHHRIIVPPA